MAEDGNESLTHVGSPILQQVDPHVEAKENDADAGVVFDAAEVLLSPHQSVAWIVAPRAHLRRQEHVVFFRRATKKVETFVVQLLLSVIA